MLPVKLRWQLSHSRLVMSVLKALIILPATLKILLFRHQAQDLIALSMVNCQLLPYNFGAEFKPYCWRWCQYGYTGATSLAASRRFTCSTVRFQPVAPRLSCSCCSVRAPMMMFTTVGRCNNQLRDT